MFRVVGEPVDRLTERQSVYIKKQNETIEQQRIEIAKQREQIIERLNR